MRMRTRVTKTCAGIQTNPDDRDVYYSTAVIISKTTALPVSKYAMPSQRGILLTFLQGYSATFLLSVEVLVYTGKAV